MESVSTNNVAKLPTAAVASTAESRGGDAADRFVLDSISRSLSRATDAPTSVLSTVDRQAQVAEAIEVYQVEAMRLRASANLRALRGFAVGALGALAVFGVVAVVRKAVA